MSDIARIFRGIYSKLSGGARDPRPPIAIPPPNTDRPPQPGEVIQPQKDYVAIRVNQLFLAEARKWFSQIEPMVFASTEFLYGGQTRTDPFVVGPKKDEALPRGTIMRNTPVFGPHPYRGGPLTYTIVLSQLPVGDFARQLLDVVESAGGVLAPALGLATYTKMGGVVIDGFEKLLGLNGVQPLLGYRQTINPDQNDVFTPGYVALIDAPNLDPSRFWVVDDTLLKGASRAEAVPYRESDFVLYQISRVPDGRRSDIDRLPLYGLWQRALEAAGKPTPGAWDEAKANLAVLASGINLSPDLTWTQGQELIGAYLAQLKAVHELVGKTALLGAALEDEGEISRLSRVSAILALH